MPIVVSVAPAVDLATVKLRLNKTLNVDDLEISDMIDKALAEYAEYVRPLPGTYTRSFPGGGWEIVLPAREIAAVTAAAYNDGSILTVTDLDLDQATGIVRWKSGTVGRFTVGTRVTLTYTVGPIPLNHVETIAADVAGYFERTQRGGSAAAFPGEGGYSEAYAATPVVLFPRIRALAPPR